MNRPIKIAISFFILGILSLKILASVIVVESGDDLNSILNSTIEGDTVIIQKGEFTAVSLVNKSFSAEKPLVVKANLAGSVIIKGNTVARGSSLEIKNCSFVVISGLTFTNSMWGIYVKNSDHIILKNNEIYETGQEGCHIGRSSKYVDVIGNKIHHTGLFNSKWAEGVYVGSGSYGGGNRFPDNCEYIWIEGNHIYETGNAEGINVKGESFHVTVRNNKIHDIHPGTSVQHNEAAITVEGTENSIKNSYRISEKRDVWVENNTISNVSDGYSDWNNGILFFGTGVYVLNNKIENCTNRGIYGNNWQNLGLQNYVYGNTISNCGTLIYCHPEVKVSESNPGENPHSPQKW